MDALLRDGNAKTDAVIMSLAVSFAGDNRPLKSILNKSNDLSTP